MRPALALAALLLAAAGSAQAQIIPTAREDAVAVGHRTAQTGRATGHAIANGGRELGHATLQTGRDARAGLRHATRRHRHRHHHH